MSNDFWLGATYTLACIFGGVLITLIFIAVLGDRDEFGGGGNDGPPPPDELEAWLRLNTVQEFPEANLIRERRDEIGDMPK